MPIYEYQCRACEHKLEALQKVSDAPLRDCPVCAEKQLRRCLSAPRFRLAGNGWYETDFKTGKKKNLAVGDKPPEKAATKESAKQTTDTKKAKDSTTTPVTAGKASQKT